MKVREVTAEQLHQGYLELRGMIATKREFHVITKTPHGTYIVKEPKAED